MLDYCLRLKYKLIADSWRPKITFSRRLVIQLRLFAVSSYHSQFLNLIEAQIWHRSTADKAEHQTRISFQLERGLIGGIYISYCKWRRFVDCVQSAGTETKFKSCGNVWSLYAHRCCRTIVSFVAVNLSLPYQSYCSRSRCSKALLPTCTAISLYSLHSRGVVTQEIQRYTRACRLQTTLLQTAQYCSS